jgi:hypothetical protein
MVDLNDSFSTREGTQISHFTHIFPLNNDNFFTFSVEENKTPDINFKLKQVPPDEICSDFFEGINSWSEDKIFNILNYSFESREICFSNAGDSPLIEGYRMAYLHHFPIVINPSHFWLMILQGFSKHMEVGANSERNRDKFVNFKGQKNIGIETGMNLFTASDEHWISFIEKLLDETNENLNKDGQYFLNLLKKKFSTSTRESEVANNVTILSSFKKFFVYTMAGTCGISKIRIEGTTEDWDLLLNKIDEIEKLDNELYFWTKELKYIIQKIIDTLETKVPDINFYKNIVQNTDKSTECKPDLVNGWIIKFIPYDCTGKKCNFDSPDFNGLSVDEIPSQITSLPFNLKNINKKGQIKNYNAEIYSGFFGIKQDKETLAIRPIVGYAIVEVKDKKLEEQKKLKNDIMKFRILSQFNRMNENEIYNHMIGENNNY